MTTLEKERGRRGSGDLEATASVYTVTPTKVQLSAIEMDASIQCRANIDTATVNEYAERMRENDQFPPIDVYGTEQKCWIGDGWHRVLASLQFGFTDIPLHRAPGRPC